MASVSGWTEAILFSLLIISVVGIIVVNYNGMYGQTNDVPFVDNSGAKNALITYQNTSQAQVQGGQVSFNAVNGITLQTSYGLMTGVISIVWSFLSGGWIEQVIGSLHLGENGTYLAFYLRILYFLSLVFALLYALFKVVL